MWNSLRRAVSFAMHIRATWPRLSLSLLAAGAAGLLSLGGPASNALANYTVSSNCATAEIALLTLILPHTVGSCVLDPAPQTFLGNDPRQADTEGTFIAQKSTAGGMFLECVFSGWTGYTDGQRTWILGPYGVMVRDNDAKLPYPYDQACTPPAPAGGGGGGGGAGGNAIGGGSGNCHINTSVVNTSNSNISAVAIAACGSNATAVINITQSAALATDTATTPASGGQTAGLTADAGGGSSTPSSTSPSTSPSTDSSTGTGSSSSPTTSSSSPTTSAPTNSGGTTSTQAAK